MLNRGKINRIKTGEQSVRKTIVNSCGVEKLAQQPGNRAGSKHSPRAGVTDLQTDALDLFTQVSFCFSVP